MNQVVKRNELILLIDDAIENQKLFGKYLNTFGFEYIVASDGIDGIEAATNKSPDLILLDFMMPGMNGLVVCEKLKKIEATKDIPIIMITASLDTEILVHAFKKGVVDYITKPIQPLELQSRINTHLLLRKEIKARIQIESELKKQKDNLQFLVKEQVERLEIALEKEEQSHAIKDEFLSNINHEIRTPMNSILGLGQVLQNSNLNQKQQRHIDLVVNSTKKLLLLLNSMLDFSKLEKGCMEINNNKFSLKDAINEVYSLKKFDIENNVSFFINYSDNIKKFYLGDSKRIQQILINLLDNAIKFTNQGKITLDVISENIDKNNDYIYISVSDTGIGLDSQKIDFIFKSFTQLDSSSTRKYDGTGLGLAISQELAKLMEGTISVSSEKGKGAKFTLKVKMEFVDSMHLDKLLKNDNLEKHQNKHKISTNKIKILVVDDSDANRYISEIILQSLGGETDFAQNGKEAVEMANIKKYDIIFMDCMMPILNGFDASKQIRNNEDSNNLNNVPIIALTGKSSIEDIEKSFIYGMNEHLVKPISKEAFHTILMKYCDTSKVFKLEGNNKNIPKEKTKKTSEQDVSLDAKQLQQMIDLERSSGKKLIEVFLQDIDKEIELLENALNIKNTKSIELHAHSIKGMIANLGGVSLSKLALEIQESPKDIKKCENNLKLFLEEKKLLLKFIKERL